MVTLREILENDMGCHKAFNGDGSLSYEGVEAVEKIIELLQDLASCGIIPDVTEQAQTQFDEIMKVNRSAKEQMIVELHEFVTHGDRSFVLRNPVMAKTEDGHDLLAKYFSRDIDYADIFCADYELGNDDATVFDMQDMSDDSVKQIYEAIKTQEIEDGWDWKEHATHEIKKKYPDAEDCYVCDFVTRYWNNLDTDTANLEVFEDWMNN